MWMLGELGLIGEPLAAGSSSVIGLFVLRYNIGIAAFRRQQSYAGGQGHGKSSTTVCSGFPVERKTGGTMTLVARQYNNVQAYATIGTRPCHTETNISGWSINVMKKAGSARTSCFTGGLQQARLTCSITPSGKAIQVYGHWAKYIHRQ